MQMIGNLCQKPVADIFHQCDDGCASICVCWIFLLTDRYRGNHRGSAQKILKQGDGIGRLGKVARRYQDSARRLPGEPAAQNINRRSELSRQIGESSFDRAARAEIFVFPAGTEDHDNVGVVERFEPAPNAPADPGCIIAIANFRGGLRHRRDALEVTQRTLGIFIKRPKNRLLFAFGRDPVGAPRRAQHAHRDADDGLFPRRSVFAPQATPLPPFGYLGPPQDSEQKLANDLQFAWKSRPPGARRFRPRSVNGG